MNQTMNKTLGSALLITLLALAGCGKNAGVGGTAGEAEVATQKANEAMTQELNLADPQDFEDAKRGFIAAPEGKIMAADGTTVLIDFDAYKFVDGKPPATVNPSLWRHATLNKGVGLYKVRDGVHQLRGFDISNITLIDGKTGWIVVDALTSQGEFGRCPGLCPQAPGQQAGHGARLHAQSRRPFRRRTRRGHAAGSGRTQDSGDRVRRFHRGGHQREHPGRHRDGAPLDVPVRQEPDAWPEGHRRYRPGQERVLWGYRHSGTHATHHQADPGADARRLAHRVPQRAGCRGSGRDDLLGARVQGLRRRREPGTDHAQPASRARRQGA
jgi:hypothetical protein